MVSQIFKKYQEQYFLTFMLFYYVILIFLLLEGRVYVSSSGIWMTFCLNRRLGLPVWLPLRFHWGKQTELEVQLPWHYYFVVASYLIFDKTWAVITLQFPPKELLFTEIGLDFQICF